MMDYRLIIDANVVAKLYLRDEQWVDRADSLFDYFGRGTIQILAPRLLLYEVPAAVSKASRAGRINESDALEALRRFSKLPLPFVEETPILLEEACRLANRYRCTFYDAVYLQLAEDLNCKFVTADDTLYKQLRPLVAYVIPLRTFTETLS